MKMRNVLVLIVMLGLTQGALGERQTLLATEDISEPYIGNDGQVDSEPGIDDPSDSDLDDPNDVVSDKEDIEPWPLSEEELQALFPDGDSDGIFYAFDTEIAHRVAPQFRLTSQKLRSGTNLLTVEVRRRNGRSITKGLVQFQTWNRRLRRWENLGRTKRISKSGFVRFNLPFRKGQVLRGKVTNQRGTFLGADLFILR